MISQNIDLRRIACCIWEAHVVGNVRTPGPISEVAKAVSALGWQWLSFDAFIRPGRSPLNVRGGPDAWWDHELREGLRCVRWAEAARTRKDMKGLEAPQGLDKKASVALLRSCSGTHLGLLRSILVGSVRLQKRLFDARLVHTPVCQFCGACDETMRHCFWECSHWAPIRPTYVLPSAAAYSAWPVCTKDCGLFVEDVHVLGLIDELAREEGILASFADHFDLHSCRATLAAHDPLTNITLWTDGASSHNQDNRLRRAGSGIFYGPGHAMNWANILPGLAQSNQRAELFAVLVACMRDPRPLDIRSDSEYVCSGVRSMHSWYDLGWSGEHADLWNLLAKEIYNRATPVHVSWVLGHAKTIDVQRGRTTLLDKVGNDGADKLACEGAAMHAVDIHVASDAKARCTIAKTVQRMMTHILEARLAAERARTVQVDYGSDVGDFFGIDFDHDTCHDDSVVFAFAQGSHAVHDDDIDGAVVVDGTHTATHENPEGFCLPCTGDLDDDFDSGSNFLSGVG